MILYHGSNVQIEKIDLSRCKKGKDFGQGFYLNADYSQALSMAERTVKLTGKGSAIVTSFEFDTEADIYKSLNVKVFDDYTEEWADFVVANRKNTTDIPIHDYDIVIGPIADDTVGVQIRRYVMGYMSVSALVKELKFRGDNAIQYFFANERALATLRRI